MAYTQIKSETRGDALLLTLNRPDRLNALTFDVYAELRDAFDALGEDDAVRGIVLTGAGRGFCAGQDLNDRAVAPGEIHGFHAVAGLHCLIAGCLDQIAEELHVELVVFDNHHFFRHSPGPLSRAFSQSGTPDPARVASSVIEHASAIWFRNR